MPAYCKKNGDVGGGEAGAPIVREDIKVAVLVLTMIISPSADFIPA